MSPTATDRLLTLEEAGELLRMPVNTLRFMRTQGTGPRMFRLGRRVVVKESDVWAWVEERARADKHIA